MLILSTPQGATAEGRGPCYVHCISMSGLTTYITYLTYITCITCITYRPSRSQGPGSWTLDHGSRILDLGSRIQDPGSWVLDPGSWILNPRSWTLDHTRSAPWIIGPWITQGRHCHSGHQGMFLCYEAVHPGRPCGFLFEGR